MNVAAWCRVPHPVEEENLVKRVLTYIAAATCMLMPLTACEGGEGAAVHSLQSTSGHPAEAQPKTVELAQSASAVSENVSFETLSATPHEVSYVAGFAAAGLSTTGKVAFYSEHPSAMNEAVVRAFARGVEEYNHLHGSSIEVVNLSEQATASQPSSAEALSGLAANGIDTVMLVGMSNPQQVLNTIHAQEKVRVIWVGEDAAARYVAHREIVLTSLVSTSDALAAQKAEGAQSSSAGEPIPADPSSAPEPQQRLTETTPTSLAPLRDFAGEVSDTLRAELDELATRIHNGTVEVNAPAAH